MGLDAVEIILRTEELFAISIADDEAEAVRTVGDLYGLICSKLNLTPLPSPTTSSELPRITDKQSKYLILRTHTPLPPPPNSLPWSPQSVWDALVAIFVDRQGLRAEDVLYHARIVQDLGVD